MHCSERVISHQQCFRQWGTKKYLDVFAPAEKTVLTMLSDMGVDPQHLKQLDTRILRNEEPYNGSARPVILYSPAFGVVKDMYFYNIQPLVESGFVVVAVGSTYESIITVFPDGIAVKQSEQVGSLESTDFEGWYGLKETRVKSNVFGGRGCAADTFPRCASGKDNL
ncbi:hypothetical protein PAECIP111891_03682 [Paenibacillus allorhizoplanae]|uniref:Uncharacterized protein n=1 Tax=Paenibacillus allorhizoplanae TaxID=2905648 RepID=A0ABN8GRL4_9BACL|nr:hypothetical protein [Paenibacillus allorhizoplanae]CAH1211088.1 hypothetical protein PAECIP111891_03682 [Paenibacillus allorhizoplanae]